MVECLELDNPPACSYVIQSYDTAFTKNERSDYSAITTWGIFTPVDGEGDAIILLMQKKVDGIFRTQAKSMELCAYDPDMILIEQKASTPLTQELRRMGASYTIYA